MIIIPFFDRSDRVALPGIDVDIVFLGVEDQAAQFRDSFRVFEQFLWGDAVDMNVGGFALSVKTSFWLILLFMESIAPEARINSYFFSEMPADLF